MAAILLLCTLPSGPLPHRVDAIEINHVYDGCGRLAFTQAILWHDTLDGEYVAAWRILRPGECPMPDRGGWSIRWHGRPGAVWSPILRRTWTQYDPEIRDRSRVEPDQRRGVRE